MTGAMGHADALYLGIDGGGTKTVAVVVDARGAVRGRGAAGGANQESVGIRAALAAVRCAADQALRAAGGVAPCAAWIGLAGVDHPADVTRFQARLQRLARRVHVSNDAELLLAALPGGIGVALVAGTGSIALGRNAAGETARCGGWGHVFGDEGSGYALGSGALRAVARAADGRGPSTTLTEMILRAWELSEPGELMARVYQAFDKAEVARLAPLAFAAARAGDEAANALVAHEAAELARQGCAVAEMLRLGCGGAALPVALGGGLLTHSPVYRRRVFERMAAAYRCKPVAVVKEPALVAARAAAASPR